MGLEFLFSPPVALIFIAFLMAIIVVSGAVFREGFQLLGWRKVLNGYLGVLFAVIAWTFISAGFRFEQFFNNVLLQSYFAFMWIAFFVSPLVFRLMPQGRPVLRVVMGWSSVFAGVVFLLVTCRSILLSGSLLNNSFTRPALIFGGWLLLMAYCFCIAAATERRRK